jgi:hypothetical protein
MHAQASTREEYHVTVEGDPFQWRGYCVGANIKPLWIELNNFERQIMCAITPKNLEDDCCDLDAFVKDISRRFTVVRVKKEVQPARLDVSTFGNPGVFIYSPRVTPNAIYYECHVKLDGKFNPDFVVRHAICSAPNAGTSPSVSVNRSTRTTSRASSPTWCLTTQSSSRLSTRPPFWTRTRSSMLVGCR